VAESTSIQHMTQNHSTIHLSQVVSIWNPNLSQPWFAKPGPLEFCDHFCNGVWKWKRSAYIGIAFDFRRKQTFDSVALWKSMHW
jgi:hypothetical protein